MATDWETRYYEQQANHTEANGMLCQERDKALRRAEAAERRLRRFADLALAAEGKADGFGSQLTADRELGFMREDFLGEHAKGADAYTALCKALDGISDPCHAQEHGSEK